MTAPVEIAERRAEVAGVEVLWRVAGDAPILYLHGVPTAGWAWAPFLERTGGIAPDLPGHGRSGKPGDFDFTIAGYDRFLESFCDHLGLARVTLVMHDWGSVGLAFAQRLPERVERVVLTACVAFVTGYRWHRLARGWRTPVLGELLMGFTNRRAFRRSLPAELADRSYDEFDHGTQRAVLKLFRTSPPDVLAAAGERLGELRCPALVEWPTADPYIDTEFGQRLADALGGPTELNWLDAGHYPWLDRPEMIDRVAAFVG
jgi:pimeloyl-ACP methyl ester carboxylesterase